MQADLFEKLESGLSREELDVIKQASAILEREASRYGEVITMTDPSAARELVKHRLAGKEREVFVVYYLNNQHNLIEARDEFMGTIDGASVHPREVAKSALSLNAAAVVLAHNHPSGIAEPSQADRRITERLKSTLQLLDVRVLDHLILGNGTGDVFSFAESGLM